MNSHSEEHDNLIADLYELAEDEGIRHLNTAWLFLNDVWWPNPHYHGNPVANPDDPSGKETNPPTRPSLSEILAQRLVGGKE